MTITITTTTAVEVIDAPARHDWSDGSVRLDEDWTREFVAASHFGLKVHDLAIDAQPDATACNLCSCCVGWTSGDHDGRIHWVGLILACRADKPADSVMVLCEDCGGFLTD